MKNQLPGGIIVILALLALSAVSLLLGAFQEPLYQLGPVLLTGTGAIAWISLAVLALSAAFFGVLKRMRWARILAIGWYGASALLLLVNLLSFLGNRTMYNSYYSGLLSSEEALVTPEIINGALLSAFGIGLAVNLAAIIYLMRKKEFFTN